jgi:4,5-DOPA dioxygenase extradiol
MSTLPALFLSHGSPMTALEPGAAGAFFTRLGPAIDAAFGRPRAIVALSAHTLTREPTVLGAARHEAIHDFGGFDAKLYTLRYDAPGAPEVAARVAALIAAQNTGAGGLDHGLWTPLRWIYPDADVPVVPVGWNPRTPPRDLFALGAGLAPLADEACW